MAHEILGPGSVIASRFRLEDLLEEHSGARFWRATDLALARNVAVHVLPADDPRATAVLHAARRSATISEPHLLRVLDALEESGHLHVVHEWGTGASLDQVLADEPLAPRRAAWLVREVAEALVEAHRRGVPHGRLLPEHVLVTEAGAVKLIGFAVDAAFRDRTPPDDEAGMAQDVRDLGALLYACLVARWAGSTGSTLPPAPVEHGSVLRPRQVRAGVPPALDRLCDALLNPPSRGGARIDSAAGVVRALGDYLGETSRGVAPVPDAPADTGERTVVLDVGALRAGDSADPEATQAAGFLALTGEDTRDTEPTRRVPTLDGPAPAAPATRPSRPAPVPPPAAPPGPVDAPVQPRRRPPWPRMLGVLVAVALLVAAALVAFDLGQRQGGNGSDADSPAPSQVLQLASVRDFDPDQDGGAPEENPDLVPLATDGDPSTSWRTLNYNDGPQLAPYKSGVGLLLDLGEDTAVGSVEVTLVGEPYDVQLLSAAEGTATPPTGTEGLDTVATEAGAAGTVTLAGNGPVTGRYFVIWLTALPRVGAAFQGGVAEIVVRS